MRRKFGLTIFLTTALFAGAGTILWALDDPVFSESVGGAILTGAGFFAWTLFWGCAGMELGVWLRRGNCRVDGRRGPVVSLLLAIVLGAGIGAVTETIYAVDYVTYTRTVDVDTQLSGRHIVFLIDGSASMMEERDVCVEAACKLIDSLDENTFVQTMAFASAIAERNVSQFLPMTAENRKAMQDFMRGMDLAGGTNFNIPLRRALETLYGHRDDEYSQIILMLTDGEGELDSDVVQTFSDPDNEIHLFTVRITGEEDVSPMTQSLINLAELDFPIRQNGSGSVDVSAVLDAFGAALASTTTVIEEHTKLGFSTAVFFREEKTAHWWNIFACLAGFAAISLAACYLYYGQVSRGQLLFHLALGAAIGAVLFVDRTVWMILYCGVGLGAFTVFEEVRQDV